ncbi:protein FAM210B, mitochondrial [Brachionichthys hirsutus]|uniref:protein FAM210B, mitochondrial n=1 Tax=Brachionichthys hirsutus TaxID=412623 RepID=UPI0036044FA7
MHLCRAWRRSAALLDHASKSTGSFLVHVNAARRRDVSLTLRKEHAFQGRRCFCASGPTRVRPETHGPEAGFAFPDWARFRRVEAASADLSQRGGLDITKEPRVRASRARGQPVGRALLSGGRGTSSRCLSTGITQTTKKNDADEQQTCEAGKGEEQRLEPASTPAAVEPEPDGGKPSKSQQLKKVFKEYGAVGVSFHICTSLMSLGMFYLLVSSGIDIAAVLCKLGFSEAVIRSKLAAGTSTFVLAYAIHKLFAPLRISITLVSVPLIVRYFRKTGLFKPPTPPP